MSRDNFYMHDPAYFPAITGSDPCYREGGEEGRGEELLCEDHFAREHFAMMQIRRSHCRTHTQLVNRTFQAHCKQKNARKPDHYAVLEKRWCQKDNTSDISTSATRGPPAICSTAWCTSLQMAHPVLPTCYNFRQGKFATFIRDEIFPRNHPLPNPMSKNSQATMAFLPSAAQQREEIFLNALENIFQQFRTGQ